MLKEIAWYLKDNRFSDMVVELDTAIRHYDNARSENNDESTQSNLREQARELFETHCLASGLRSEEAPYINIDQEFFDGKTLDEPALDSFIKNIIKGYCYQKVLWTYMGTTESFTQISKDEMKNQGLKYEDYLPIKYKKDNPAKKPFEHLKDDNTVLFYAYSDGTISQEYFPEKAKIRFDALQDASGFDWKKAYNPNGEVKKTGWVGAYDEEGTWVQKKTEDIKNSSQSNLKTKDILLIRDGDSAILYDPGTTLLFSAAQLYLTEEDALYGSLEYNEIETLKEIKNSLSAMGVSSIKTLAGLDVQNETTVKAYLRLLADVVDTDVAIVGKKEAINLLKEKKIENQKKEDEGFGIHLEKRIQVSKEMGCSASDIKRSFAEHKIAVPLSFKNAQDAKTISLSDEEYGHIQKLSISEKNQKSFDAALCNILAAWPQFAGSGVSKIELANMVYSYVEKKEIEKKVLNAETTLSNIFSEGTVEAKKDGALLFSSGIPGIFTEDAIVDFYTDSERDLYIENLEKKHILPKDGAIAVKESLMTLPNVSHDIKQKLNRALTRSLGEYNTIAISTGMPIKEVITQALAYAQDADTNAIKDKRVYYELPLKKLMEGSSKKNYQKKEVEIHIPTKAESLADSVDIVVGGLAGTPLNRVVELKKQQLTSEYGYTEQEATKIENFLHSVTVQGSISTIDSGSIRKMLFSHLNQQSSSDVLKKDMLELFDVSPHTTYNLANQVGFNAYVKTNRFKSSSLTTADLEEIVSFDMDLREKESGQALKDRIVVKPRYVSSNIPINFNRISPRGIPEKIYTPYTASLKKGLLGSDTNVRENSKTDLGILSGDGKAGVFNNFLPSRSLVGQDGITEDMGGPSAQDLINTNSTLLEENFGYERTEAEKVVELLKSIKVGQGKEGYFVQKIQPVIENALAGKMTEKEFREILIKDLAMSGDISFNRKSSLKNTNYIQSVYGKKSDLGTNGLKNYIQQVYNTDENTAPYARTISPEGIEKDSLQTLALQDVENGAFSGGFLEQAEAFQHTENGGFTGNLPEQAVALRQGRARASTGRMPEQAVAFRQGRARASTGRMPEQAVAFRQARSRAFMGDIPEYARSIGHAPNGTSPGSLPIHAVEGDSFGIKNTPSTLPQSFGEGIKKDPLQKVAFRQRKSGPPTESLPVQMAEPSAFSVGTMPSAMPQSSVSMPGVQTKTATSAVNVELARLRRMEENYEKDKAMLQKETSPALARSASHDIGHAEDNGVAMVADEDDIKQMKKKFDTVIASQLTDTSQV